MSCYLISINLESCLMRHLALLSRKINKGLHVIKMLFFYAVLNLFFILLTQKLFYLVCWLNPRWKCSIGIIWQFHALTIGIISRLRFVRLLIFSRREQWILLVRIVFLLQVGMITLDTMGLCITARTGARGGGSLPREESKVIRSAIVRLALRIL